MVSKYETKFFKHQAKSEHICSVCGKNISINESYFNEETQDAFLNNQLIRRRQICEDCYKKI